MVLLLSSSLLLSMLTTTSALPPITPVCLALLSPSDLQGIILEHDLCTTHPHPALEELASTLGSEQDMQQVGRNPLLRARFCLKHVAEKGIYTGRDMKECVPLMLSFINLCFHEYQAALKYAKIVINAPQGSNNEESISKTLHTRRQASARMYAAEAECALGNATDAMKYLMGTGTGDTLKILASDLSGVTLSVATNNIKGRHRLAHAQAMVRCSASVVSAVMGDIVAAKELAMSAQTMEDAYASNREQCSARRALLYWSLRFNDREGALTLLKSMRLSASMAGL
jgi:hypothetical protein